MRRIFHEEYSPHPFSLLYVHSVYNVLHLSDNHFHIPYYFLFNILIYMLFDCLLVASQLSPRYPLLSDSTFLHQSHAKTFKS